MKLRSMDRVIRVCVTFARHKLVQSVGRRLANAAEDYMTSGHNAQLTYDDGGLIVNLQPQRSPLFGP